MFFFADKYEAMGGVDDYLGSVDTFAEAIQACEGYWRKTGKCSGTFQIAKHETMTVVAQCDVAAHDPDSSWNWRAP